MVQIVPREDKNTYFHGMGLLYRLFLENQDNENAEKVKQVALKLKKEEYNIAFCGHFSAGKSSMINFLLGEELVPSSPIPTSANLVKIKNGKDGAKVYYKKENPKLYPAPYDIEMIRSFCMNGDEIEVVELICSSCKLPENVVFMDTPGIDSTDDAHRIATESSLHIADLVLYVMDYNHVQSEVNFLFTKELALAGKEIVLIINQIDKHRNEEIDFQTFTSTVAESFASWGVHPIYFFFTSLKDEKHPLNELIKLQHFIQHRILYGHEQMRHSIANSLRKIADDHLMFLKERDERRSYHSSLLLNELSEQEKSQLRLKYEEEVNKLQRLQKFVRENELSIRNNVDSILKNAYLMPYQIRELAESYLQSCQPDYKIGFLFSKKKAQIERHSRLNRFYQSLSEQVKSQIDWHIKELFYKGIKENNVDDPSLLKMVQHYQVPFTEELLVQSVNKAAGLSGDYVLLYTNEIAELLKKIARKALGDIFERYIKRLQENNEKLSKQSKVNQKNLQDYINASEELEIMAAEVEKMNALVNDILSNPYHELDIVKTEQLLSESFEDIEIVKEAPVLLKPKEKQEEFAAVTHKAIIEKNSVKHSSIINRLYITAQELKNLPGFHKIADRLLDKAKRVENKQFTVALFGAFSAGKSSFANALLGTKLLPVSPNPTTASINKIMPIDQAHPHGTVLVKLKSTESMLQDINLSLQTFQLKAKNLSEAQDFIKKVINNRKNERSGSKNVHYNFLQAFSNGYESYENQLGNMIEVDLKEFQFYVVQEEKSCFVELIEVYYDCSFTRKGITLVDTPGADSINARHTAVSFDYIKNSDAILFITYYHHAFSKADREFLIQLGRVKDAFELDKMFFLVNAIDLAEREEDLQAVMNYVKKQLITFGIRSPHLYGVSSLIALIEKLEGSRINDSRIHAFENDFYSFLEKDLMMLSIARAENEWDRAIQQLKHLIRSYELGKEEKEIRKQAITDEKIKVSAMIKGEQPEFLFERLQQETDELLYYLKQRVFFRYQDFIREAFNPAVIKGDNRTIKSSLQYALKEFLSSFGFDFAQELRATTLRLEAFIYQMLSEYQNQMIQSLIKINHELSFSEYERQKSDSITFKAAFENIETSLFQKALAYFKNPKFFFEGDGRNLLSEEIEAVMKEPADDYLQIQGDRLENHYKSILEQNWTNMVADMIDQSDLYYAGIMSSLSEHFPIDQLKETEKKLLNLNDGSRLK
ncbi:dynamin family protein [Bacillus sp. 03113]|uniref:dynamin family protein n=1 Tax=Bacillus sp. 03113 TaxID=2578211 RepID=UPI001143004E|nr:dynamin family protein [Bacillus sp. 03113]